MSNNYNFRDLVASVAGAFGLKKNMVSDLLRFTFEEIADKAFIDDCRVHLPKLGTFYLKRYPPRKVRNDFTGGEERIVPTRWKLAFKPSKINVEYGDE